MTADHPNHALTLAIPQTVYESLVKVAKQIGQKPENLAVHWLTSAVQQYKDDPLEQFIGAFTSDTPDWVEKHDAYIGQAALNPEYKNGS